jgi:Wzt C-terminal domain
MTVAVDYVVNTPVRDFVFALYFKRTDGIGFSIPNTKVCKFSVDIAAPGSSGTVLYQIPQLGLLSASYVVAAIIYDEHLSHEYDHIEDAVAFRVVDDRGMLGIVDLQGRWQQHSGAPGVHALDSLPAAAQRDT